MGRRAFRAALEFLLETEFKLVCRKFEEGMSPPDIARATVHGLQAVDNYLGTYAGSESYSGKASTRPRSAKSPDVQRAPSPSTW